TVTPGSRLSASRLRLGVERAAALPLLENFAAINPGLNTDHPVGGVGFGEAIIDIGAQGVQRKLSLQIPFTTRNLRSVQASGDADFDSFATEAERRIDRLAHRAAEGHTFFELQRDRFGDQLRVELGLVDFLNVDEDFALGALGQVLLQLL